MKILFVTDLHGDISKYRRALEAALKHGAVAIVNGGDMLTLDGDLHGSQRECLEGFLFSHFKECSEAGVACLGLLGNDDLKIHDDAFDKLCRSHKNCFNLAQRRVEMGGFEFIGMNWVADYPFRLKDRCRPDAPGHISQKQFGSGLLSTDEGFRELGDWPAYAANLPDLDRELAALPTPSNPAKAVYVIHMPPAGLGLDVISSGERVGSAAVRRFIETMSPLLTLHGHIHESPAVSGEWKANVGNTVCIQPGQSRDSLTCVLIDLAIMSVERFTVAI